MMRYSLLYIAPFSVILPQGVGEKTVFDNLIKNALENSNFEQKTISHQEGRLKNNKQRLLPFFEDNESRCILIQS